MNKIEAHLLMEQINGGKDFFEFAFNYEIKLVNGRRYENVLNPFYEDKNPSLSIYSEYDRIHKIEKWYFHDFGSEGYVGDAFFFAALYYKLNISRDFTEILEKIVNDLGIDIETVSFSDEYMSSDFFHFGYELRTFSPILEKINTSAFFSKYSISYDLCKEYNVSLIKGYRKRNEDKKDTIYNVRNGELLIAYKADGYVKLYRPGENKMFWYLGIMPENYVFGWREIQNRVMNTKCPRDILIITGGEKDVLSLAALGYDAISLSSENARIPDFVVNDIFPSFSKVVVMYDNDETGLKAMEKICSNYKVWRVIIPEIFFSKSVKDISDCMKVKIDINTIHELIAQAELHPKWTLAESVEEDESNSVTDIKVLEDRIKDELILKSEIITNSLGVDSDEQKIDECPDGFLIPDTVYSDLPVLLKDITNLFPEPTSKDLVLLSSLAVFSTCFPRVKGVYRHELVGSNLYIFIAAPAASGKGDARWSKKLITGIERELKDRFLKAQKQYRKDLLYYDNNKDKNLELEKPEEPIQQIMSIPANSSATKMIEMLGDNVNFGLLFETEGDVVSNALKNDWSDSSTTLRSAFQHESISLARKGGRGHYSVDSPHLSVLLTGTPRQIPNLIKNVENGLMSRFLFYNFAGNQNFINPFLDGDKNYNLIFEGFSKKILDWWIEMEKKERYLISFTNEQELLFTELFNDKMSELIQIYGEDIIGSVKRMGLCHFRICMVLTAIRQMENHNSLKNKLVVNDTDFIIATDIINTLINHLTVVFKQLSYRDIPKLKLSYREQRFIEGLSSEFTWEICKSIASNLSIPETTAGNYLRKFKENGLIVQMKKGIYQKIKY